MNQCKIHIQSVGNRCCSLGASSIWTDYNSILEIGNILLYVSLQEWFAVQVINRDIEEALVLGVVQIHSDDMVGTSTGEQISDKGSSLCDPLFISRLCLKESFRRIRKGCSIFVVVGSEWGRLGCI